MYSLQRIMKEGFDVKEWTLLRGNQAAGTGACLCAVYRVSLFPDG